MRFFCECCDLELWPEIINVVGNHTVCDDDDCIDTAKWYVANIDGNSRLAFKPSMQEVHVNK